MAVDGRTEAVWQRSDPMWLASNIREKLYMLIIAHGKRMMDAFKEKLYHAEVDHIPPNAMVLRVEHDLPYFFNIYFDQLDEFKAELRRNLLLDVLSNAMEHIVVTNEIMWDLEDDVGEYLTILFKQMPTQWF